MRNGQKTAVSPPAESDGGAEVIDIGDFLGGDTDDSARAAPPQENTGDGSEPLRFGAPESGQDFSDSGGWDAADCMETVSAPDFSFLDAEGGALTETAPTAGALTENAAEDAAAPTGGALTEAALTGGALTESAVEDAAAPTAGALTEAAPTGGAPAATALTESARAEDSPTDVIPAACPFSLTEFGGRCGGFAELMPDAIEKDADGVFYVAEDIRTDGLVLDEAFKTLVDSVL